MTNDIVPELIVDDEFQSLIPPLSEEEFESLEQRILDEGFHEWEPIVIWSGKNTIVDGHNRYRICKEHNIQFVTVEREFANRDAVKIWIIEHQFSRRNLSKYARSVLALTLEPLYAAEAKRMHDANGGDHGNQHTGGKVAARQISDTPPKVRTDEQLAKLAGTSRDTIRKVKVIETEAAKGNQTAIVARDEIRDGKKSINAAYIDIRPKADKSDRRPLCTICGKPIDEGDSYDHNRFKHKSCASADTEEHRGLKGGRAGARLRNADYDLLHNVATYTIESLVDVLTASVKSIDESISTSIALNERKGVVLTAEKKQRIESAISSLYDAINQIKD